MAAPSGQVLLPRTDMGGVPLEGTLQHGIASWDAAGTYTFIVPRGVTRLLIDLKGGTKRGAAAVTDDGVTIVTFNLYPACDGSRLVHWVDVTPGVTLTIVVGAGGTTAAGGVSTVTGLVAGVLTAAGGDSPSISNFAATRQGGPTTAGATRAASTGGNVISESTGDGYCVIQW